MRHLEPKLIKSVRKPKGDSDIEVSLYETATGFCVGYEQQGRQHLGEIVNDFRTASYMFDLKLQDLEGH